MDAVGKGLGLVRALLSLCLAGQVICASAAALAGEPPPQQRELLLFEEPVVTAAAKHPQSLHDAPSAVTVITREEIRRFGYRTLAEALRSVRGFYGTYDRNYSYIGVRGFLRPGDYNNRILLLVNGHTYNDDIYGSAYLGPEFGIDLEAVDRIEVVRGPGSALYGGNAMFAVVNVVTASGQDLPGVRSLVETGSFGRKRGQVSVGHVFRNGLDVLASGSVLDLDGHGELFYPEYNAPETNNGIARDADAERALNFFLSAQYGNFFLQGGANRRDKHIPTGSYGTTFNDPGTKAIDGRQFAELQYSAEALRNVDVTARAFYDGLRYHGTYIYGAGASRDPNEDIGKSHWMGAELRAQWHLSARNTFTLGTGSEYSYHPSSVQENFSGATGKHFVDDHRSYRTLGVYAQNEWSLLPGLTLVTGARFDRYYGRLQEVSPRIAAIWNPRPATHVKLLYGHAFRPPNLYEQYYEVTVGDFGNLGNPHLDPERITTYEAVLEQELWNHIEAALAIYHYDLSGLIDPVQVEAADPNLVLLQFQNLSAARANGAELELRVPLPHGMSAHGTYSFQEARAAGGQLLTNSPKHLGNLALLFPLPFGVEAGAELQMVGPRTTLAGNHVATEAVANLTLNYQTPLRGLYTAAGFYNLFDQRYADPGGPEHVQDRIRQDGFTFRVQLGYGF